MKPWLQLLATQDSQARKFMRSGAGNFNKHKKVLLDALNKLEGKQQPAKSFEGFFGDNDEVVFAVLIQNCLQPKNSNRVDAIKSGSYVQIESEQDATLFLSKKLATCLEYELNAVEGEIAAEIAALAQMHDVKVLLEAPDVFVAAAAMSSMQFYQGRGDRSAFLKIVLNSDPR